MLNDLSNKKASDTSNQDVNDGEPDVAFKTPEQTAELDKSESVEGKPKKPARWAWLKEWQWPPTKKQWILIAGVVVIIGGLVALLLSHHSKPIPIKKAAPKVVVKPVSTTVPSTLTGLPVQPSVNQRPVTGVMIENSDFARPQSGLDQAGVVFEAVAEGGITRFLALFQDTQPSYIGPVRSARPYYLQWCLGFDCALAHVGGSPEALSDITSWNVKNLDEFYNGSYYQRISARAAPHNVYTSLSQLNSLETSKGFGAAKFTGFSRKIDQPSKQPTASSIDFSPSSSDFNSHYDYVVATNNYKRSEGGAPHMEADAAGNQVQITPKVVIALVMQQGIEADDQHTSYVTLGSGQAYVFQDGSVTVGTWQKTDNNSQITFADSNGTPIKLNAGQTWITIVGQASDVSYK